jgi:hypothetical protein
MLIGKEQRHKDSKDTTQPKYKPSAPFTPPLAGDNLELGNRSLVKLFPVAPAIDVDF